MLIHTINRSWLSIAITALVILLLAFMASFFVSSNATAATTCVFTTAGSTMHLTSDCTTDGTIYIPHGFTLDGHGYTITAEDPSGDHFRGAVVKNAGTLAFVENLTIDTNALANACDAGDDRLRGILFEGASGVIEHNTVLNINQGTSGCQEGNGIEVRNAPFDGTHPNTQQVGVYYNTVTSYQKGGIIVNGDVLTEVQHNTVTGLGPVNFIAQNGIQLGYGAAGYVENNTIWGNVYTPATYGSGGILIYGGGDNIHIDENTISVSDIGIWLAGGDDLKVTSNTVASSTWDAIALDDQGGSVSGGKVSQNYVTTSDTGIGLYGSGVNWNVIGGNYSEYNTTGFFIGYGATYNEIDNGTARYNTGDGFALVADMNRIKSSSATYNGGIGIGVNGTSNVIKGNVSLNNGDSDVQNVGSNYYKSNICQHSSGSPVDCGNSPIFPVLPAAPVVTADPAQY